ncbi:MAG: hypothetical protein PUG85_01315 [Oscillospiraceae bacterium]|nr:hypothetical protein [Oscillospiraceae bacterium]MDY2509757.1 hypothetical protein [Ruminococcus callidus]
MPKFNIISPSNMNLSLEAVGVLSTMLNVPESDYCTVTQLHEAIPADSVSTIQTALDELYAKEYVIRLDGSTYAVNKLKLFQMKLI